jgi:hypothetical protein
MTWNKAYWLGLAIAVLSHVLVFAFECSSVSLFPGFMAHYLIGGLHGGVEPFDTIASIVEMLINAVMYSVLIYGVFRLRRGDRGANQNH